MRTRILVSSVIVVTALSLPARAVRADIAPPLTPQGTTVLPGVASTQVRMMAETVTISVASDPSNKETAIGTTEAIFTMRNLGSAEEKMQVRFPLSFFNGSSDGRFEFPEIPSITAKVNGKGVATHREMQPPVESTQGYTERDEIPWSVFDVTFPPAQDVSIAVTYKVKSYGYYPQAIFDYVLETGAGWNGAIGSVDIIVRLPYEVSEQNALLADSQLGGTSTPHGVLEGNEIRWHYEDLEPTPENNIEVILVTPSLWQSVLRETEAVSANPRDGEAWGRLGKAYKEAARLPKGWLRDDPAATTMLAKSSEAYEKCVSLLPKDALWHYGYADLLWWEYYQYNYMPRRPDAKGLLTAALRELHTSLQLDPKNAQAQELLIEISSATDGIVEPEGDNYVFLGLTATPELPTPYPEPATETAAATTPLPRPTATKAAATASPLPPEPTAKNPLCGGVMALLLPIAALYWNRRRHVIGG